MSVNCFMQICYDVLHKYISKFKLRQILYYGLKAAMITLNINNRSKNISAQM